MCRLVFMFGSDHVLADNIVKAMVSASRFDVYKYRVFGEPSHSDGWGFIAFSMDKDGVNDVASYVSLRPIYEDNNGRDLLVSLIGRSRFFVVALHSRSASIGTIDILNNQPMVISGDGRVFKLWLLHNGSMNKDKLANDLGVKVNSSISDTYYLSLYIFKNITKLVKDDIIKVFKLARKYTKTAMNTISLILSLGGKLRTIVTCYIANEIKGESKYVDYYRMYLLRSNGLTALVSSTIADNVKNVFHEITPILNRLYYFEFLRGPRVLTSYEEL